MLGRYRTHHMGWNVKHFHEHLQRQHGFGWGYTWTKLRLQAAGLVERSARRGPHRRKRPRKPCVGMTLHQDASPFAWLEGAPDLDLVVTLDDATSEIYSAFLVEEEGTVSTLRALLEVFTAKGLPSSLYTDRGSHYFLTPTAGEAVDKKQPTQVGRALARLGIEHIPAYSPQARGRSERMFSTLQGRLPKPASFALILVNRPLPLDGMRLAHVYLERMRRADTVQLSLWYDYFGIVGSVFGEDQDGR